MKRTELLHRLAEWECVLIRHGGRHDWYQNPNTGVCQPVPLVTMKLKNPLRGTSLQS